MITCGGSAGRATGEIDAAGIERLMSLAPDALVVNDPAEAHCALFRGQRDDAKR
jgi:hypothetical protein